MPAIALAGTAVLVAGGFVMLQVHARPFVRSGVETPIYAVGDAESAVAFANDRPVTKRGPIPLGLYPGSRAFESPREAREYLRNSGRDGDGSAVFELSGDFDLDTREVEGRHYITRTLLVVRRVDGEW
jgi:hypothetical protein